MYCRKCGSQIGDNLTKCPICNEIIAQTVSEDEIQSNIDKKTNFKTAIILVIVAYVLRFITNMLLYSLPRLLLLFWIIALIIALIFISLKFFKRYKTTKSVLMLVFAILEFYPILGYIKILFKLF